MAIFKYIYLAGIAYRNKKILKCYRFLKESEKWQLDDLRQLQLEKLKLLLSNAYANTDFYRKRFDECCFHPSHFSTLDDLKKLPVTEKEDVLANVSGIQIKATAEKMYFSETSGSTGRPLVFYRNQEWDAWHNASVMRGYSWHGVSPWERNGYLWGYNISLAKKLKVSFLDFLQNRFRLFSYESQGLDRFLSKLQKASYLNGYSSMIYEIAKRVNAKGISSKFRLKMVKGTSEKIYDVYREEVQKAFGIPIVSEYGSAEGGIIAFECTHGNMHINMETVIVEEVDNEILVTNLVSTSFPIIRYRLGDYVKLGESGCGCGMAHPIIKEVTGRVGALIHGKTNTYPSLTLYYVFKNLASIHNIILNYQAVQKTQGALELFIESEIDADVLKLINKEFSKYFKGDLDVSISTGVPRSNYNSKKKDFVSQID